MNIEITKLSIENFKGIKKFNPDFEGGDAVITGANGTGKTTVFDAFLWLLFGKDSQGKKDFSVRPLDENNKPIPNLVLCVEVALNVDGVQHVYRKEHHENVVKGQLRGYETLCWIDEVPKKVGEFQNAIAEVINEDTFKLLTDTHFFNEKLHWKERRSVLLELAGEIGTPEGFDALTANLKGRTIDEYKKVLADQKKRLSTERDQIGTRIDELQRGLDDYAGADTTQIEKYRDSINIEIDELDTKRSSLLETEKERQQKIDALNDMKTKRLGREYELKNDTGNIDHLLKEKSELKEAVSVKQDEVTEIARQIKRIESAQSELQAAIDRRTATLDVIRKEYAEVKNTPIDTGSNICEACGRPLPAGQINKMKAKLESARKARLKQLTTSGNAMHKSNQADQQAIDKAEAEIKALEEKLETARTEADQAEVLRAKRTAEIDNLINSRQTTPPEQDPMWIDLNNKVSGLKKEIGTSIADQIETIEKERKEKSAKRDELNTALAQADNMKRAAERIKELKERESELSQQITDVEAQYDMIGEYITAESDLITEAVNSKFQHVTFKLFKENLNGSIDDTCEALLDGVPYSDMSCGQKIMVGVDIINALAAHYDLSVPLFIDNAESLTLPIEFNGQSIRLFAKPDVQKVTVTVTNEKEVAA